MQEEDIKEIDKLIAEEFYNTADFNGRNRIFFENEGAAEKFMKRSEGKTFRRHYYFELNGAEINIHTNETNSTFA